VKEGRKKNDEGRNGAIGETLVSSVNRVECTQVN